MRKHEKEESISAHASATTHNEHATPIANVPDARVDLNSMRLSLGTRMLQKAGLVQAGPNDPVPDKEDFRQFRTYYQEYRRGEDLDAAQTSALKAESTRLRETVLSQASAVVTTNTLAVCPKVSSVCTNVRVIFKDEAARPQEIETLSLLAHYLNVDGVVLVGDPRQLKPRYDADGPFAGQPKRSLMERALNNGTPSVMFKVQHRMAADIAAPPNVVSYRGLLQNHPSLAARPLSQAVVDFNHENFRLAKNLIYVNMVFSQTHVNAAYSKYNPVQAKFALNLAAAVLREPRFSKASVAILTPYQAQLRIYLFGKDKMIRAGIPNADKLIVETIDRVQGLEVDFGILDIPIDKSAGFLGEPGRVNVGITRFKHGGCIISSKDKIDNLRGFDLLKLLQAQWTTKRHKVDIFTDQIACRYYQDDAVQMGQNAHRDVNESLQNKDVQISYDNAPY